MLIGNLLNALGLDTGRKIGGTALFFIYDVIKITGRFHGIEANIVGALIGTVISDFGA